MEDTVTMLDQNAVEARRKLRNGAQRTSDCWETALGVVGFHPIFSRNGRAQASLALYIRLNKNVLISMGQAYLTRILAVRTLSDELTRNTYAPLFQPVALMVKPSSRVFSVSMT